MSLYDDQLAKLEQSITENRKTAELGDALNRLMVNRDFRKIILEGFFETEAVSLVRLKGHPAHQSAESQKQILMQMDAIGVLSAYFEKVVSAADLARKSIGFDEETRDQLSMESLNVS